MSYRYGLVGLGRFAHNEKGTGSNPVNGTLTVIKVIGILL